MDEAEESEFINKLTRFIKENTLIAIIFTSGLILLGLGIASIFSRESAEITIEKAQETVQQEDVKASSETVVDIGGAVQKPGLYRFSSETRVHDVLVKAGGLSEDADREYVSKVINLASKVSDGEKIYIPRIGEENSVDVAGTSSVKSGKVNINKATVADLVPLPGIGEVTAQKIISGRPYSSVDQLLEKKVVSSKVFEEIKDSVSVY